MDPSTAQSKLPRRPQQAPGLRLWVALGLWLGLGLVGNWCLGAAWRSSQVAQFTRTIEAVAGLIEVKQWREPWENDPDWIRLEERLEADLVPLPHLAETKPAPTDSKQSQSPAASTWLRTPTGAWRATVTVPLKDARSRFGGLRATRTFAASGGGWVWWLAWSALGVAAALLAMTRRQEPFDALPAAASGEPAWPIRADARLASLEQAAGRLEQVLDHLNEGVLAVDDQGRVVLINRILRSQLELGSDDVALRPLVEVVRLPRVVELFEHVLSTGQSSEQTLEVGSAPRFLRLAATSLPLVAERPGVLLTATDVSSTQRSELARREFVTGASHELKTPLAAIRAYTETLQAIGQDDPEATERFLTNILTQADRMDRLVTGMLQLARAESGNLKLRLQRIDAAAALQPCLTAALAMAHAKDIAIDARIPSDQVLLMADRDAFQTIASNLLSNAVRYTAAGGRIDVDLARDGDHVVLRVRDTGIGISEADQRRVFERFFRVQKDRATDTGGTGLGLAIVKQLAEALDGSIELTSRKGEGTCFEIRLPAVGFTQSSSKTGGQRTPIR